MLTLNITGLSGHTEVAFEGEKVVVKFHKTSPAERGMIAALVEKGLKKGLKLHHSKKGEPGKPLDDILAVLLDRKNEVVLTGTQETVEDLALDLVEKELKQGRLIMEAQEDGSWKVVKIEDLKKPENKKKKRQLTSTALPFGG